MIAEKRQYSKFDGFSSIEDMVKTAKSHGMTACGLTDHGTFAGAIDFLRVCRAEGIRPVLGMEAYLCRSHEAHNKEGQPDGRRGNRHINLIAKNYVGFQNICSLSQIASLEGFYYDPRVDSALLEKYSEGVIATSACFVGSQLVSTLDGLSRIDELSLLDQVLTKRGRYDAINQLTSRHYDGDIYQICCKGHFGKIKCTADHKILVSDKSKKIIWKEACHLTKQDRLLTPVSYNHQNFCSNLWDGVDLNFRYPSLVKGISSECIPLNVDTGYLLGLYLSEGSASTSGRVQWTLNIKERSIAEEISSILKEYFGLEATIVARSLQSRIDVTVVSEELNRLLVYHCGKYAYGKYIGRIIKKSPSGIKQAVLRGLFIGDGSRGKCFDKYDKFTYASVSGSLCSDVRELCLSLGVRVTTAINKERIDKNRVRHRKSYYLFAYGLDARKVFLLMDGESLRINYDESTLFDKIGKNNYFITYNDQVYFSMQIKDIVPYHHEGPVYCLSQNDTSTFVVDGYCVHNCLSNIVNALLAIDKYEEAKKTVGMFQDIYGEDYYMEIMFHGIKDEAHIIPYILKISKELGVKAIATNDCFVAGTLISTQNGCSKIEDLQIGDKVYTHDGCLQRIEYTNKTQSTKNITIVPLLGSIPIVCTPNHPVFAVKFSGTGWGKQNLNPEWISAQKLSKGDLLCIPKYKISFASHKSFTTTINTLDYMNDHLHLYCHDGIIETTRRDKKITIPIQLPLDRHFCQVFGFYLAEGYIDGTVIGFGFHKKEKIFADIITSYFEKFNLSPTITEENNSLCVRVNSSVFSALFLAIGGTGSEQKKWIELSVTKEETITIIRYYLEGDGYMNKNGASYMVGSVSKKLIWKLSQLFQQFGILSVPHIRDGEKSASYHPGAKSIWRDLYVLNFAGENLVKLNNLLGVELTGHEVRLAKTHSPSYAYDENYFYVRIKDVYLKTFDGDVYNLQVAENKTFVANSYIVHNCHYIRKEDAEFHEVIMCISSGKTLKDPRRIRFPHQEFYFKSKEEMASIFASEMPSTLRNTLEIAEKCDYSEIVLGGKMLLPKFDIPKEYDSPYDYLKQMAKDGLVKCGLSKSPKHVERLKTELSDLKLIWDTKEYDFSTYFLIVEDMIRFAKKEKIACGIRGSGYGSLLLKTLGIVEEAIDPLFHGLLWERFLGFDSSHFLSGQDFGLTVPKTPI